VEERHGQDKRTIWFDCSLWGKRGEGLAQYLTKGAKVAVSGELSTREHDGKTYLTIRADQVTLMGGKPEGGREDRGGYDGRSSTAEAAHRAQAPAGRDMDDEIPF
jgi:single-strand DNA-binding protein